MRGICILHVALSVLCLQVIVQAGDDKDDTSCFYKDSGNWSDCSSDTHTQTMQQVFIVGEYSCPTRKNKTRKCSVDSVNPPPVVEEGTEEGNNDDNNGDLIKKNAGGVRGDHALSLRRKRPSLGNTASLGHGSGKREPGSDVQNKEDLMKKWLAQGAQDGPGGQTRDDRKQKWLAQRGLSGYGGRKGWQQQQTQSQSTGADGNADPCEEFRHRRSRGGRGYGLRGWGYGNTVWRYWKHRHGGYRHRCGHHGHLHDHLRRTSWARQVMLDGSGTRDYVRGRARTGTTHLTGGTGGGRPSNMIGGTSAGNGGFDSRVARMSDRVAGARKSGGVAAASSAMIVGGGRRSGRGSGATSLMRFGSTHTSGRVGGATIPTRFGGTHTSGGAGEAIGHTRFGGTHTSGRVGEATGHTRFGVTHTSGRAGEATGHMRFGSTFVGASSPQRW